MSTLQALEDLGILLIAALLPALVYLIVIRRTERYQTEPWSVLLSGFAWGAVIATFVAAIIEAILISAGAALGNLVPAPEFTFLNPESAWNLFFVVLVIAPLTEEGLKGLGTVRSIGPLRALADGPVVGASVGLGFGFLETFLYGLGAFLVGGLVAGLGLILIRSVSSVLLHGSSTAIFGYGYARSSLGMGGGGTGFYYLVAVGMHASFNLMASLSVLLPLVGLGGILTTDEASLVGLILAVTFAFVALQQVEALIAQSSYPGAEGAHPRFRPPPARRRTP